MLHPPGTILQFMHLKERIKPVLPGEFLEIGCGAGHLSKILLHHGWKGIGLDLNSDALNVNRDLNRKFIENRLYEIKQKDFFLDLSLEKKKFDLIISSMVLEHFDETIEKKFIHRCKTLLKEQGSIILFVPASEKHWGIEDEIAGHFRRYTRKKLHDLAKEHNLKVNFIAGLTFPLSNLLLPISNYLIRKHEYNKIQLTNEEKTIKSGHRFVKGKTHFPRFFGSILNEFTLFPMHIAQKIFKNNKNALVLYTELIN